MLAATDVSFIQKVIGKKFICRCFILFKVNVCQGTRERFLVLVERQLPFGQLPLLQIDDQEIVQSQVSI